MQRRSISTWTRLATLLVVCVAGCGNSSGSNPDGGLGGAAGGRGGSAGSSGDAGAGGRGGNTGDAGAGGRGGSTGEAGGGGHAGAGGGCSNIRPEMVPPICGASMCGNGVRNSCQLTRPGCSPLTVTEPCDGNDLGGDTCQAHGFASGTLSCSSICTVNTSGCAAALPPPTP